MKKFFKYFIFLVLLAGFIVCVLFCINYFSSQSKGENLNNNTKKNDSGKKKSVNIFDNKSSFIKTSNNNVVYNYELKNDKDNFYTGKFLGSIDEVGIVNLVKNNVLDNNNVDKDRHDNKDLKEYEYNLSLADKNIVEKKSVILNKINKFYSENYNSIKKNIEILFDSNELSLEKSDGKVFSEASSPEGFNCFYLCFSFFKFYFNKTVQYNFYLTSLHLPSFIEFITSSQDGVYVKNNMLKIMKILRNLSFSVYGIDIKTENEISYYNFGHFSPINNIFTSSTQSNLDEILSTVKDGENVIISVDNVHNALNKISKKSKEIDLMLATEESISMNDIPLNKDEKNTFLSSYFKFNKTDFSNNLIKVYFIFNNNLISNIVLFKLEVSLDYSHYAIRYSNDSSEKQEIKKDTTGILDVLSDNKNNLFLYIRKILKLRTKKITTNGDACNQSSMTSTVSQSYMSLIENQTENCTHNGSLNLTFYCLINGQKKAIHSKRLYEGFKYIVEVRNKSNENLSLSYKILKEKPQNNLLGLDKIENNEIETNIEEKEMYLYIQGTYSDLDFDNYSISSVR